MKKVYSVILTVILLLFFVNISPAFPKSIRVVTTLRFLKDITKEIGKDKVDVISILKGTENPHTYEAKPKDIVALSRADLFIEVGGGLEGFVDKILKNVRGKKLRVIVLISGIELIDKNPHIWLDPKNGKIIAKKIKDALTLISPSNNEYFKENLDAYIEKIDKVEKIVEKEISSLPDKRVISSLPSFVYFYKRFGIEEMGRVVELPGHEPSLKKIRDLIVFIKKHKIPYIITNPLVPVKPVNIIKEETGIKEIKLLPLLYRPFGVNTYLDMIKYNGDAFLKNE